MEACSQDLDLSDYYSAADLRLRGGAALGLLQLPDDILNIIIRFTCDPFPIGNLLLTSAGRKDNVSTTKASLPSL